jgi:hypothetical protein
MQRVLGLTTLVVLLVATGCSTEAPAAPSVEKTVGKACSGDGDCASLPAGYCARGGFCARVCTAHSDCGCPSATSACGAACVKLATGTAYCVRTCTKNADCEIGTCQVDASLGYKVCGS